MAILIFARDPKMLMKNEIFMGNEVGNNLINIQFICIYKLKLIDEVNQKPGFMVSASLQINHDNCAFFLFFLFFFFFFFFFFLHRSCQTMDARDYAQASAITAYPRCFSPSFSSPFTALFSFIFSGQLEIDQAAFAIFTDG